MMLLVNSEKCKIKKVICLPSSRDNAGKLEGAMTKMHHQNCHICLRAGVLDGLGTVEVKALAKAGAWATLLTTFWTSMALKT